MSLVGVSCRVVTDSERGVRSDTIDQRWWAFLRESGLVPVPLPNDPGHARRLVDTVPFSGIVLTGGNDLAHLGGDAPERDATEELVVGWALAHEVPVIGVCRGMQVLLHHYGVPMSRVSGHVAERQEVRLQDRRMRVVNSYHRWAPSSVPDPLEVWATGPGGVAKAVRHPVDPVVGVMWHPERLPTDQRQEDHRLFHHHLRAAG